MLVSLLLFFQLFILKNTYSFDIFEPNIQCTIIRVHKTFEVLGFKKFPEVQQSINNNSIKSILYVAGKEFLNIHPVTLTKLANEEIIDIKFTQDNLRLELKGVPMSRMGVLKVNGKLSATVTCH